MKILDISDMLQAAEDSQMPGLELHTRALEAQAALLAGALASHLKIQTHDPGTWKPGFGGLCASFVPVHPGQSCPPVIDDGDPEGEWEPQP